MNRGLFYLLTGTSHAVRLVVSLWSLRQHYAGPVTVFTTEPESHVIGRHCATDSRLNISHVQAEAVNTRKNSAFLTKLALALETPYDLTAYLDCDTLVCGDIEPLFNLADTVEFHATQFADWLSTSRVIRRRIDAWKGLKQSQFDPVWLDQLVADALQTKPAVNGGVFCFRKSARLIPIWHDLAMAGWKTFICDEIALQLLLPRFPHRVLDCRFNCSPIYGVYRNDARIWHFHGEKHLSRDSARQIWWPAYQSALELDLARLRSWTPCGDPALIEYENAFVERFAE